MDKNTGVGLPFPSPGDLPDPGTEFKSPAFQADSLSSAPSGKPKPSLWRVDRESSNLSLLSPPISTEPKGTLDDTFRSMWRNILHYIKTEIRIVLVLHEDPHVCHCLTVISACKNCWNWIYILFATFILLKVLSNLIHPHTRICFKMHPYLQVGFSGLVAKTCSTLAPHGL